jgi:hypothetical protein
MKLMWSRLGYSRSVKKKAVPAAFTGRKTMKRRMQPLIRCPSGKKERHASCPCLYRSVYAPIHLPC